MSDERKGPQSENLLAGKDSLHTGLRERAEILLLNYGLANGAVLIAEKSLNICVDAMLAFYDEAVSAERARCAKVCRDLRDKYPDQTPEQWAVRGMAVECAEAIEQEPT